MMHESQDDERWERFMAEAEADPTPRNETERARVARLLADHRYNESMKGSHEMENTKPESQQSDIEKAREAMYGKWYVVDAKGNVTCPLTERGAIELAEQWESESPHLGPFIVCQLAPVGAEPEAARDDERMRWEAAVAALQGILANPHYQEIASGSPATAALYHADVLFTAFRESQS